jgi:hypothetical protein
MKFIHIRSPKFSILPGEEAELVNPGMWGKALSLYLRENLPQRGYEVSFTGCEDWGWWVSIDNVPFTFGVCIWCGGESKDGLLNFAVTDSTLGPRKWSWLMFRFVDTVPFAEKLHEDLLAIFREDPEVTLVGVNDDATRPPQQ